MSEYVGARIGEALATALRRRVDASRMDKSRILRLSLAAYLQVPLQGDDRLDELECRVAALEQLVCQASAPESVEEEIEALGVRESDAVWLTTREAYQQLQGEIEISWNRFRRLTPEALRARFNLEAAPERKQPGRTDSCWLRFV